MALYTKLHGTGITTPEQLGKLIACALNHNPDLVGGQREENQ